MGNIVHEQGIQESTQTSKLAWDASTAAKHALVSDYAGLRITEQALRRKTSSSRSPESRRQSRPWA